MFIVYARYIYDTPILTRSKHMPYDVTALSRSILLIPYEADDLSPL